MKKCSKCKLEKNDKEFSPSHFKKSGGWCRHCNTEYMKEFRSKNKSRLQEYQHKYGKQYYQDNKNDIINSKKEYYKINKEKILEDRKKYYLDNKDQRLIYNKSYYKNNRNQILEGAKIYALNHKEERKKYGNSYSKHRRKISISYRLKCNISANINFYLKSNKLSKNKKSTLKYLPYYIQELKNHLENQFKPWMNWNNYGKYNTKTWDDNDQSTWTWQIDHIIPHSTFKYISMDDEEFKKCWSLDNLRPLSAKQNFMDGVNRIRHK